MFYSNDPVSDAERYYEYCERLEEEREKELAEEEYIEQQIDEQLLEQSEEE